VRKILLISTNALGDTYIACSAFKPLKELIKDVEIDIVSSENSRFFLKEIGFNKLFLIKQKSYAEVLKTLRGVRKTKYDFVFNFFPGQVNSIFFSFSKSDRKIGFKNLKKVSDWHNLEDYLSVDSKTIESKVWKPTDNFLDRVRLPLSILEISASSILKPVFYSDGNSDKFNILFHPFSSDERKSIPHESILKTAQELFKSFEKQICIIGSAAEIENLKKNNVDKNIHFLVNPEIKELTCILKNCELFIGADSFPLHIADAYDIKTLGIFSITDENSVFQNLNNKYIFRENDIRQFTPQQLINFIKEKNLLC